MANNTCTINVPGYRMERGCTFICHNAAWTDIALFFVGNYLAHVATVKSNPGDSTGAIFWWSLGALFVPLTGMLKANAIVRGLAIFGRTPLQKAARAGALLMVVPKKTISPSDLNHEGHAASIDLEGGTNNNTSSSTTSANQIESPIWYTLSGPIHGMAKLPRRYGLAYVPADASFNDTPGSGVKLACTYNILRISASLIQLGFSTYTLYRTRGDQIDKFGYASFGLTTIPYAYMSLVNLFAPFNGTRIPRYVHSRIHIPQRSSPFVP